MLGKNPINAGFQKDKIVFLTSLIIKLD